MNKYIIIFMSVFLICLITLSIYKLNEQFQDEETQLNITGLNNAKNKIISVIKDSNISLIITDYSQVTPVDIDFRKYILRKKFRANVPNSSENIINNYVDKNYDKLIAEFNINDMSFIFESGLEELFYMLILKDNDNNFIMQYNLFEGNYPKELFKLAICAYVNTSELSSNDELLNYYNIYKNDINCDLSTNPITTSTNPITTSTNPITTSTNPITTSTNPITSSTNPITSSTNPITTSTNPITTSTNPITTSTNPITTSTNPITTSTNPITTSTNPITTSTIPIITSTKPIITSTKPTITSTLPASTIPICNYNNNILINTNKKIIDEIYILPEYSEYKKLYDKHKNGNAFEKPLNEIFDNILDTPDISNVDASPYSLQLFIIAMCIYTQFDYDIEDLQKKCFDNCIRKYLNKYFLFVNEEIQKFPNNVKNLGITICSNELSQKTNACFTGDSLVLMADYTTKKIKDITIEDMVISVKTGLPQNIILIDKPPINVCELYGLNEYEPFATTNHPFISIDNKLLVVDINNAINSSKHDIDNVREIKVNDSLYTFDNNNIIPININNITFKKYDKLQLYNIITEDHTFFINNFSVFDNSFNYEGNKEESIKMGLMLLLVKDIINDFTFEDLFNKYYNDVMIVETDIDNFNEYFNKVVELCQNQIFVDFLNYLWCTKFDSFRKN